MRATQPDAKLSDIAKACGATYEYAQNVLAREKRNRPRPEHEPTTWTPPEQSSATMQSTHALEQSTRGLELVKIRRTPRAELREKPDAAEDAKKPDELHDQGADDDVVHACAACKAIVPADATSCTSCGEAFA